MPQKMDAHRERQRFAVQTSGNIVAFGFSFERPADVFELGIAGIKYACDFNGYYGGPARSPILRISAEEKVEIEQLLSKTRN